MEDIIKEINQFSILSYEYSIYLLIIGVLFIKSYIKKIVYKTFYIGAIITFVGVLLHELSHLITGILLGAKPRSMSLIPKKVYKEDREVQENPNNKELAKKVAKMKDYEKEFLGVSYGSVGFQKNTINFINALPIAIAPLSMFILVYYIYIYFFNFVQQGLVTEFLLMLIIALISWNATPSSTDINIIKKNKGTIFFWAILIIVGVYIYNPDIINIIIEKYKEFANG